HEIYTLSLHDALPISETLKETKGVEINKFSGPHPAGNVGVQIHHIDPINKGETVWIIHPQDVLLIGKYFLTGKFDATRLIALTGDRKSTRLNSSHVKI